MILPGTAAIPAVHADRLRAAEATGAAAVRLIGSDRTPDRIVNAKSVENALRVLLALGGSTNAVIHLTAIAGRAGVKVSLERINELSDSTPVLVNLKPVGNGYMEDFSAAGGMGVAVARARAAAASRLHDGDRRDARRAPGSRPQAAWIDRSIIAAREQAVRAARRAGRAVRQSCAQGRHSQALGGRRQAVRARGAGRWCSPRSPILPRASTIPRSTSRRNDVLVLQNAGPHAPAAMPEAGYLPIPKKARPERRQGHDPRFRRAHERHRLRHHRAACDARFAPPAGRSDWCATATASACRSRSGASTSCSMMPS